MSAIASRMLALPLQTPERHH